MIDLILISFFFLSALFDVLWCVLVSFLLMVIDVTDCSISEQSGFFVKFWHGSLVR